MRESDLLSYCLSHFKKHGIFCWRVTNGAVMHRVNGKLVFKKSAIKGFPDVAGLMPNGRFFAVELKTPKGVLADEQREWIRKLNHHNAIAVVLRSYEEIDEFCAAVKAVT